METERLRRHDVVAVQRDEAVRRGIPVEYGKRLVGADTDAGGVTARFADGSTDRGDLLVGADGLRSVVRTLIDPGAPAARYVPLVNTGGYVRGINIDTEPGVTRMMFGKRAFLGMVNAPNGEVWWFSNVPQRRELSRAELAAISQEEWKSRLLELFADDGELPRRIIRETESPMLPWNTYDFPRVPTWHRDRMVIIGDAAHATSPAAGQGASMAIEDAVELARCVRRAVDNYIRDLDGERPGPIYDMVVQAVERPLLEMILAYSGGNQTIAAEALGMNRNTLRKKLKAHGLL